MDIQTLVDNACTAAREKELKSSPQLLLGEIKLKLESVKNKSLPIYFDKTKHMPTSFDSWRGRYNELAIQYEGRGTYHNRPKPDCDIDQSGDHSYSCKCGEGNGIENGDEKGLSVEKMIELITQITGKIFVGYKGGDFLMGKNTPVWIANYGECSAWDGEERFIIEVTEQKNKVIFKTQKEAD